MTTLFWRQFRILAWKNWVILSRHIYLNFLRCLILPVAFGVFLQYCQYLLIFPNNFGLGSPRPIPPIIDQFDGSHPLIWTDSSNGTTVISANAIMSRVVEGFTPTQLAGVKKVASASDIPLACPQTLNQLSKCFAAIDFNNFLEAPSDFDNIDVISYTLLSDGARATVDVEKHGGDAMEKIMPLQWAVDQAIIEMKTGLQFPQPLELPFSQNTNQAQHAANLRTFMIGIRRITCLAFFICYIGVAYQLPGEFADERAGLLASHMKAMGLADSSRIISWHVSMTLAYLPAWIIIAIVWHFCVFTHTSVLLVLVTHFLLGLSLASWSFFVAASFGNSPQLAAITSTLLAMGFAIIACVYGGAGTLEAAVFSVFFPPGYYIFAIRAICGFEINAMVTDALKPDPDNGIMLFPLLIVAGVNVILWPYLAVLLERRIYDARDPTIRSWSWWPKSKYDSLFGARGSTETYSALPPGTAISIRNLEKSFRTSFFHRKTRLVTAITDLSLDIPKYGIFVLLGSNGAGKTTTMSIIAGLLGRTGGSVTFEGGEARPPRGTLGIVPQKNVLFPGLTCYQTLRVWSSIKRPIGSDEEDLMQLLRDCDLEKKTHSIASTLSGGQKRKLQLAIGLVGGSNIVLVDECTSGIDPLARRAIWRILSSFRQERTIVFTTHFLDEADLLADNIAVLVAPGKLVANESPVTLKTSLGEGYSVQVKFSHDLTKDIDDLPDGLLSSIRLFAPEVYVTAPSSTQISYHLRSKDPLAVEKVLVMLDRMKDTFGIVSYDVIGTNIEDIFLQLMTPVKHREIGDKLSSEEDSQSIMTVVEPEPLALTTGQSRAPWHQALVIFQKRLLIARRSWLPQLVLVLVAVAGSTVPTFFMAARPTTCIPTFLDLPTIPMYLPISPFNTFTPFGSTAVVDRNTTPILTTPPDISTALGISSRFVPTLNVADNATLIQYVNQNFRNISLGAFSLEVTTGNSLFAWETSNSGLKSSAMLNLGTNILLGQALQTSALPRSLVLANYATFPLPEVGLLPALQWAAFFGAAMAVYTAFFALYVAHERSSSVQAMQLSNGLSNPVGLWLGHLLFDAIFAILVATLITIIFATTSNQFHGLGFFWAILVLYGIDGALLAYCVSLVTTSPLSAFAATAGYEILGFLSYLVAYLAILTFSTVDANGPLSIAHFTLSLVFPIASVLRAAFVSVNLFELLCDEVTTTTPSNLGSIMRFGGPILYLVVMGCILFAALVLAQSGSIIPRKLTYQRKGKPVTSRKKSIWRRSPKQDVAAEARAVSTSNDVLRVMRVSKAYDNTKVVDDVSLGVSRDTVFALLGPSGAGKTVSFSMISGDIKPDKGEIYINGVSVVRQPRAARLSLGLCPQFTAIDSQLTVREHLEVYARLKGLSRAAMHCDIELLMDAIKLTPYAERLASKLSGGNQRKLSLAIALLGNPSLILIDEFSTGVDVQMKREMWQTLKDVAGGKAIVITTHSMEEATALANKVGIISKQILAIGKRDELCDRYATYEVHFATRTREDAMKAHMLMSEIPGARKANDVANRYEIPIRGDGCLTLAQLFSFFANKGVLEFTVEKATLESIFLKVVNENKVLEEDTHPGLDII